ncbi:hypothetical protein MKX03_007161, partial [Papaver bracteatum]
MLYYLLKEERLNGAFLEAENIALQEVFYRIDERDQFLGKFIADNNFLRSVYESNKEKIILTDEQQQQMAIVYNNLNEWEELNKTPENLLREMNYKEWSAMFQGKTSNAQSSNQESKEDDGKVTVADEEEDNESDLKGNESVGHTKEVVEDHQQLSEDEYEVPKDD